MKLKTFIIGLLFLSLESRAQLIWVEGGLDMFEVAQQGVIYIADTSSNPNIRPQVVDRALQHIGLIFEGYYPINFGTSSYDQFSTGPVFGISITKGRKKDSYDPNYGPEEEKFFNNGTGNIRFPILWSIRTGNMIDPSLHKYGFEFAAGMHIVHINTADEIGWATLPGLRGTIQYRRISFGINYYPVKYTSYYRFNGEDTVRLKNTLFSLELKYSYDLFLGSVD